MPTTGENTSLAFETPRTGPPYFYFVMAGARADAWSGWRSKAFFESDFPRIAVAEAESMQRREVLVNDRMPIFLVGAKGPLSLRLRGRRGERHCSPPSGSRFKTSRARYSLRTRESGKGEEWS